MQKNIYIYIGSPVCIYQIMQYARKDKDFIEKNGYWFPRLEDLNGNKKSILSFYENVSAVWENELWRKASNTIESSEYSRKLSPSLAFNDSEILPSDLNLTDMLKNMKKHLDENSTIHNVCMFLHILTLENNELIFLKHIQLFFPEYNVHIRNVKFSLEKLLVTSWCASFFYGEYCLLARDSFFMGQSSISAWDNLKEYYQSIKTNTQKYFGPLSYSELNLNEEAEILPDFKSWVNMPYSETQIQQNSLLFSPPVLTFLLGLSCIDPKIRCPLIVEDDFLAYGVENPSHYLQTRSMLNLKKKWNEICDIQEEISIDKEEKKEQKTDIVLSLPKNDAKALAQLISSDLRKELIKSFTIESLPYKPINERRACAALLLAEEEIIESEFEALASLSLGYTLPYVEDKNKECFDIVNSKEEFEINTSIELCGEAPKVTVITLCYNHAKFIEQNIKSVLMQKTNFPVTHIISDDFSTDGTRDILLRYAKKYPHIKLILRDFNNGSQNVQNLFNEARSTYVVPCDGDDYFLDCSKLQTQVDFLEANPKHGLCFHPVFITYEDSPEKHTIFPRYEQLPRGKKDNFYLSDLIRGNFIQTNTVMYKWRFQNGLPLWFNTTLIPGDWHWHILHAETGTIGFQKKIMSVYRRHSGGMYIKSIEGAGALRRHHGTGEITTCKYLDEYFNKRYHSILIDSQLHVFFSLALDAEKNKDDTALKKNINYFPDLAKIFKEKLPEMLEKSTKIC